MTKRTYLVVQVDPSNYEGSISRPLSSLSTLHHSHEVDAVVRAVEDKHRTVLEPVISILEQPLGVSIDSTIRLMSQVGLPAAPEEGGDLVDVVIFDLGESSQFKSEDDALEAVYGNESDKLIWYSAIGYKW